MIPLYLRIKPSQGSVPVFSQTSDTTIVLGDKHYEFSHICNGGIPPALADEGCVLFIGPTGSGKTTTLKSVLMGRVKAPGVFISAFEVSDNKTYVDLLEGKTKRQVGGVTDLKRARANVSVVEEVLHKRSTHRTRANSQSSRSCLVVTLLCNGKTCTYIDLMGNEKFEASDPGTKAFANTNMSTITQVLANSPKKITKVHRTNNFITNYIFKQPNIQIVLSLDMYGDETLTKSSLNNIASLVKDVGIGERPEGVRTEEVIRTVKLPSYAKPTAASLSPSKPRLGSPLRTPRLLPVKMDKLLSPVRPSPRLSPVRSALKSPARVIPARSPTRTSRLTTRFYENEIANLRKMVASMQQETFKLKEEHAQSINQLTEEKLAINNELIEYKQKYELLVQEVAAVRTNSKILEHKNEQLVSQVKAFGEDIAKFRTAQTDAHQVIFNLKMNVDTISRQQDSLHTSQVSMEHELHTVKASLSESEDRNKVLQQQYTRVKQENEQFRLQIEKLTHTSDKLEEIRRELLQQVELSKEVQKKLTDETTFQKEKIAILHQTTTQLELDKSSVEKELERLDTRTTRMERELSEKNQLIVCSNTELEMVTNELESITEKVAEQQKMLELKEQTLVERTSSMKEAAEQDHQRISQLEQQVTQKDEVIALRDSEIDSITKRLQETHLVIQEKTTALQCSQDTISNVQNQLHHKSAECEEKEKVIQSQACELLDKDSIIDQHLATIQQLEDTIVRQETLIHSQQERLMASPTSGEALRESEELVAQHLLTISRHESLIAEQAQTIATSEKAFKIQQQHVKESGDTIKELRDELLNATEEVKLARNRSDALEKLVAEGSKTTEALRKENKNLLAKLNAPAKTKTVPTPPGLEGNVSHWTRKFEELAMNENADVIDLTNTLLEEKENTAPKRALRESTIQNRDDRKVKRKASSIKPKAKRLNKETQLA